ncbi:Clp protease N-terminal domain-containing protein [Saccharothrix variisporea]|uniref:ClpA/ClpB-like protein n=1 Tax=Saccharothrix variisporea TaxID=543527 RepID=A0A495XBN7_9PSEU|nr:Clp protease N-terminal domain-containing protein [Saccharothrix variisporea]RKT71901.1 ClpA/ClpB-like protein [Saccharothrix variisporea]
MIGERFTRDARQAVLDAVEEARRDAADAIGAEHLLLALLDTPVLASFDVPRAEVEAALRDARRKGGLSDADAEALRGLGIDVDQVVASVERSLGEGVLAGGAPKRRRFFRNHLPFAPAAKNTLVRGLAEARDLGHGTLGKEHLVLALLSGRGLAAEVLRAKGVDYTEVRKRVVSARR